MIERLVDLNRQVTMGKFVQCIAYNVDSSFDLFSFLGFHRLLFGTAFFGFLLVDLDFSFNA